MIDGLFDNAATFALKTAIKGIGVRVTAIADNIANVDTPGYRRKIVSFEGQLQRALERAGRGMPDPAGVKIRVDVDRSAPLRFDGSNVDIFQEEAELAKNAVRDLALKELLNRRYELLWQALSPGA